MSIQATEAELAVPVNTETGEPFLYTMEVGDRLVHADTNEELVAAILGEEYLDETDPETAFEVRLEGSITIATAVQESIVASAVARGDLDAQTEESVWTPLLETRETAEPAGERWDHQVPLVLVRALFMPFADRAVPTGNVLWIDPIDDVSFLDSVQTTGLIRLREHDQIEDPEETA